LDDLFSNRVAVATTRISHSPGASSNSG
jgi:hypothetical protein